MRGFVLKIILISNTVEFEVVLWLGWACYNIKAWNPPTYIESVIIMIIFCFRNMCFLHLTLLKTVLNNFWSTKIFLGGYPHSDVKISKFWRWAPQSNFVSFCLFVARMFWKKSRARDVEIWYWSFCITFRNIFVVL